jgi:4-amino-4-deoxy-L-arabinose transferase-like glycosyltransferase
MDDARSSRRDLMIVAGFICLTFIPFMGKAYHIDEPWFLEVARHILSDPRHPFDFTVSWYGRPATYAQLNSNPPLFYLISSLALKLTGGGEWAMRLVLLPMDIATGLALYLLAARFLQRPLLATLIVIATPAYLINMDHVMAEKSAFFFGLWGLYAFVRGLDDDAPPWFWLSAVLLGSALLSKFSAVVFLGAAAGYGAGKGFLRRIVSHAVLTLSGVGLYLAYDHAAGHGA